LEKYLEAIVEGRERSLVQDERPFRLIITTEQSYLHVPCRRTGVSA